MDIRKLELLVDIAETKNLTLTAERMGLTQSGISHSIKKLEEELGLTLLSRTNHGVTLTADAEALLPHIRNLILEYHHFYDAVDSINGLLRGSITIGTYSSIAVHWLPSILREFGHLYPQIKIQVKEGSSEDIEKWFESGIIDCAFVSQSSKKNYDFIPLETESLYAVVPNSFYEMPEFKDSFPIEEFAYFPYISLENISDNHIYHVFDEAGIAPQAKFYCKDAHSIIAMVAQGLGITLLPSLYLKGYENQVKKIPLSIQTERVLGISTLSEKNLTVAAKAFIKVATETIKAL